VQGVADANRPSSLRGRRKGDSDNDDEENVDCQQPVVPSCRENVHVPLTLETKLLTWFGLSNEPVAHEVECEEQNFEQSLRSGRTNEFR
jgi:hypothetical protein